ncbi:nucleotidyltransferase domain-containing protein [Methanobrevibacter curvatus]|uniref:protein adenylyltransferase n=1 Tax=Methanobrevibacter curvatus TaxID=49547 RepID=A0A165Z5W6_9EURY|nr:nucleotidyltransferase domain-containing protein [Methanobrevibacter curvatus]KZX10286.1 nucleotidyltransferase domain protein [Methanobrevibacter curvatus]
MNRKQLAIDFAESLKHPEIEKIILYGSVARGEDSKYSDIDILIITNNESAKKKIKDDIHTKTFNILLKTGEFISTKIKSSDYCKKFKDFSYFINVNREGIVLN